MLTDEDLRSLHGVTITRAETRDLDGREHLRLHLEGGGVLAISADAGASLDLADQTSIP